VVVTTDRHAAALDVAELGNDLLLGLCEPLCQWGEARGKLSVVTLRRQLSRPVERQVEVAATVVQLAYAA